MKRFITNEFLLQTPLARKLYHEYAEDMPIIDYHCHLPPAQIADDQRWANITQIWLYGDHYKWRAMRANGVPERFCTGNASDREKFDQWAATVPRLVKNQLYNWTHLELARYFGIDNCLLGPDTADRVWRITAERLADRSFSSRNLLVRSRVVLLCTTDDPTDTLEHHKRLAADRSFPVKVLPAWRPDKAMAIADPAAFNAWADRLAERAGTEIASFDDFRGALQERHDFFHAMGCRLSDHGLETMYTQRYTEREIKAIFRKVRGGRRPSPAEIGKFRSAMLYEFAVMDHEKNWTQQYHLGVLRNVNSRMMQLLGPDTGYDVIGDFEIGRPMAEFLDRLNREGKLARTIVYNINPRDNAMLVSILGAFQDGSCPGKMQYGSAWWFLDQKDGMERQMEDLSQNGLLSRFVGMLTDSRSFLSFARHEYFRRILCNMLAEDARKGAIPSDADLLGSLVRDVCYNNAAAYFGFDLPACPPGRTGGRQKRGNTCKNIEPLRSR